MKNVSDADYIVSVMGVGYVGKPLICEFSHNKKVIAFDVNEDKIEKLKCENTNSNIEYTSRAEDLKRANAIIVCVPTPIDNNKTPNLEFINNACKIIGKNMSRDTLIVFESSYMPTYTEEHCIPLIEKYSNMENAIDFYVGYSPERINPGDRTNTLNTITKLISAQNKDSLNQIEKLYCEIDNIDLYKAKNIKVAELSKLVENCQRDLNIAFINEIAKLCHKIGIDVYDVLDSASTKWNFMRFNPGLVGGDCVGVNSYYLMQLANEYNLNLETLNVSRKINTEIEQFISDELDRILKIEMESEKSKISIAIYGYTYKENIADTRNTRVAYLYQELIKRGYEVNICDYNVECTNCECNVQNDDIYNSNVVILTVPHSDYLNWNEEDIEKKFKINTSNKIFMDIRSIYKIMKIPDDIIYWSL